MTVADRSRLPLWGGVECTVNRVRADAYDQIRRTGHHDRPSDVDDIGSLGLDGLRVPVLWERVMPRDGAAPDWTYSDRYLGFCRDQGLRPIVGLLHHGSGPAGTDLLDPRFPAQLAAFAGEVAHRYPWVQDWTPVNEPLTTARFSGLYGHWYPHRRDDRAFIVALLHQVRAIGLAMAAIRAHVPAARLIQTEDVGITTSSESLCYQRDFENLRRWWSLDLLCGDRAVRDAIECFLGGATEARALLADVLDHPSPPDVIGVNHYVTSNRHLDERIDLHPGVEPGTNGRHLYVDTEAVRIPGQSYGGFGAVIDAVWARYRSPIALTEVHIGCTREEQLRWLAQAWNDCRDRRGRGVDVVAVTAWAIFGSVDWDSLVTRDSGRYEAGLFDARGARPRATATARMVRSLARTGRYDHPVLAQAGWWARDVVTTEPAGQARAAPPILLFGASGVLGAEILRHCALRNLRVVHCDRRRVDIADARAVDAAIAEYAPWAVVNAAGYSRVRSAEAEIDRCIASNRDGAAHIARACARAQLPLLTYSTHMVFGGDKRGAYLEEDATAPLNVYAQSKCSAERLVRLAHPRALIVRSGPFAGSANGEDFIGVTLRALRAGRPLRVPADVAVTLSYLPDLVEASLDLLIDEECGVWHLSNEGQTTWARLAWECAEREGLDTALISPIAAAGAHGMRLPLNSALASRRGAPLPALSSVLDRRLAGPRAAPTTAAEIVS